MAIKKTGLFLLVVVVVFGALYAGARFVGVGKSTQASGGPRPASVEYDNPKVTVTGTQQEAEKHPVMEVARKVALILPSLAICDEEAWKKQMQPLASQEAIEGALVFQKLAEAQAMLSAENEEELKQMQQEKERYCKLVTDFLSKNRPTYYDMRLIVASSELATVYWRWGFEATGNSWVQRWVVLRNSGDGWKYAAEDFTRGTWAIGRDGVTWYSRLIQSDAEPGGE